MRLLTESSFPRARKQTTLVRLAVQIVRRTERVILAVSSCDTENRELCKVVNDMEALM